MNVPVFIEIEIEEQAEELRAYFKSLGAEITLERSDKGFEDDLHKIIGVSDACFKETNAKDVQAVRLRKDLGGGGLSKIRFYTKKLGKGS